MKLVYEDDIQVRHEGPQGGSITSLKMCPHGVNVWNGRWDLSLCKDCSQPERSKREDVDYFGMKAEFKKDGLCYLENGRVIDPSQTIDDAVL